MPSKRRSSRRRRVARATLGLALLVALVAPPLLRERVRRTVEARLEAALGGRARVGEIETLRPRLLVLGDLSVEGSDRVPLIGRLRAERVTLRAPSWRAGLAGLHDDALIEGLDLLAGPDGPDASFDVGDEAPASPLGHFRLERAVLRVPGRDSTVRLGFEGEIRGGPRGPAGELRFHAAELPLEPLATVAALDLPELLRPIVSSTSLTAVSGRVLLAESRARVTLDAEGGRIGLGGTSRPIDGVAASAELGFDGASTLGIEAAAPWARSLSLTAGRSPGEGWALSSASALGVDAAFVPSLHSALADWRLQGSGDCSYATRSEGGASLTLAAELAWAELPVSGGTLALDTAQLRLAGSLAADASALALPEAALSASGASWTSGEAGGASAEARSLDLRFAAMVEGPDRLRWTDLQANVGSLRIESDAVLETKELALNGERGWLRLSPASSVSAEGLRIVASAAELRRGDGSRATLGQVSVGGELSASFADVPSAFEFDGSARAASLALTIGDRALPESALLESQATLARGAGEESTRLDGRARLGGGLGSLELHGRLSDGLDFDATWRADDPARVLAMLLPDDAPRPSIESLGATGRIEGSPEAARGRARLALRGLRFEAEGGAFLELPTLPAALSWSADEPALRFELLEQSGSVRLADATIPLRLALQGRWTPGGLPLFRSLELDAGRLGALSADSRGTGDEGRLRLRGLALGAWLGLLASEEQPRRAAQLDGDLSGDLSWRLGGERALALEGELRLRELGLQSEDGSRVLQGASGDFALRSVGLPWAEGFELVARSADFGGFEAAWGTLYGDWSSRRAGVELALSGGADPPRGPKLQLRLALDPGSRLELGLADEGRRASLEFECEDLASTWETWLAGPLEGSWRGAELRPRGAASLRLDLSADESGGTLFGGLELSGIEASWSQPRGRIQGLDLHLPIQLSWTGASGERRFDGPPGSGRLAFEELSVGRIALSPYESALSVRGEALAVVEPLRGSLFGGEVEIDRLAASGLLGSAARLEGGLALAGLQLPLAAAELDLPPLDGRLDADFDQLSLTGSELRLRGRASAQLYGGLVETNEIVVSGPFAHTPKTQLSLRASELDLARLTSEVGFGLVTGRLDGRVDDLRLQAAMPVGFSARFETVPRPGLPQTISVEAAENITALGSGGSAGVFERSLLRYFDRYRYERAGFAAELHHGVILLSGVERRGRRELFVKGRPPLRLDVVNADPGRALSFQGLLDRVNNLNLESVRIETGSSNPSDRSQ